MVHYIEMACGEQRMKIKLRVKEVAKEKGISMNRLSRSSDLSLNTIQRIWKDPYTSIKAETLAKLAIALQVDISELIEYEDE